MSIDWSVFAYPKPSPKQKKPPKPMKQKSSKLAKLERNRFSILTDDMEHCYFCKKDKQDIHEVFGR